MTFSTHAIEFENYGDGPLAGPASVPAAHLDAFLTENDTTRLCVARVYTTHPGVLAGVSRGWGKCWWSANTGRMSRIGAGAYGDATVWESPDPADHKVVWR